MKPQLRNWQTTITGALLAGLLALSEHQKGLDMEDWKNWIIPVGIAVLGFLTKDANKSTEDSMKP